MNVFYRKKVLVLGGGISGVGVAKVLAQCGAFVVLSDNKKTKAIQDAESELLTTGVLFAFGEQNETLLDCVDYLVLSPGISLYSALPQLATARGIEVISEIEVAYRLCNIPLIAITGTNGKTTTTALLGELLKASGYNTVIGGNIGAALSLEITNNTQADVVVAEISSYQLEAAREFRPNIAAILNLTPDHLERHKTMEEYLAMKAKIFARQRPTDFLVLNYDDEKLRILAATAVSKVIWFSRHERLERGVFIKNGQIVIASGDKVIELMHISELKLFGAHNVENVLAAVTCAYLFGANLNAMVNALRSFAGVEHRIEWVREFAGINFYNDSKATNPESTIPALLAFDQPIILLAGGKDKNTALDELMQLVHDKKVRMIIFGEAASRFAMAARAAMVVSVTETVDLASALKMAMGTARTGDVVLLSPACASYDQYNNFEERGRHFKQLVNELE
ncbi:MAG: UDP-N-acetylmuramoyl-L-alanine--D-glutamate ligase [Negativicutes bacterium]